MTQIELIEKRRIWKAILVLLKAEIADESAGICFYIGEIVGHANIPRYNSKSDRAAWPEFFKYEPKTKYIERTHFQTPQPTLYWWKPCSARGLARRIVVVNSIINNLKRQINESTL
jgi:hypothetical protein